MKVECVPQSNCPMISVEVVSNDGGCPYQSIQDWCGTRIAGDANTLPPNEEYGPVYMSGQGEPAPPGVPPTSGIHLLAQPRNWRTGHTHSEWEVQRRTPAAWLPGQPRPAKDRPRTDPYEKLYTSVTADGSAGRE
jgi:hypothetical protein